MPETLVNGITNGYSKGSTDELPNGYSNGHNDHYGDKTMPIAVVGLALRFPQDATSPESFWQMLVEGRSARSEVPEDRFNIDAFHHAGESRTGSMNVRGGHFIEEDIAAFDAPFFQMTPVEAASMDPMQRWLLETTYEALENAGLPMDQVTGSKTSVFIGNFLQEYKTLLSRDPQMAQKYKATGTALSMLANRLSWFYNFTGPSISLDTACSSSLNALHLACQSLRCGESTMGVVGGCNLFYNPDAMIHMTDLGILSPDSISYSFDQRANGYARGEGVGIVILKPLSKALDDNDTVRAVIRASAINQDGRTPGITQPSSRAQEAMIREAYRIGGIDMASTRFLEAHGAGTPTGDPLEASAIGAAFQGQRSLDKPLYVGAVKTNVGHLEGASGLAGLIKTILVLEKGIIPQNLWFEHCNPKILTEQWNIKFPLKATPWPTAGLRRASVNSFGFGGANAHVVLDDAYNYLRLRKLNGRHTTRMVPPAVETLVATGRVASDLFARTDGDLTVNGTFAARPVLLTWSAVQEGGLKRIAAAYRAHLLTLPPLDDSDYLADLAYTLSERRSRLLWGSFAVTASIEQLCQTFEKGFLPAMPLIRAPKVGFIFTGQGAQWYAMGRELLQFPVFRRSLEDAQAFLSYLGCPWLLIDEFARDKKHSRLDDAAYSQPVCTALQIALVELLQSWGIRPAVVVGHSSGEIAAAFCVGGLSRDSAWRVAYYRGLVASYLTGPEQEPGAMMSVALSEAEIQHYLPKTEHDSFDLSVGCINGPQDITLSGSESKIDAVKHALQQDNISARKLKVRVAYHSKQMGKISNLYHSILGNVQSGMPLEGNPVMFSSVTGSKASVEELSTSKYWVRNMVSPVKFLHAITNVCSQGSKSLIRSSKTGSGGFHVHHFLELGPHAALRGPIKSILTTMTKIKEITYGSVLIRDNSALKTALESAGVLHCLGFPVDLKAVNGVQENVSNRRMLVDLPSYPFDHSKTHWLESRLSKSFRFRKFPPHELLGTQTPDWNPLDAKWRNLIGLTDSPWINDHKINGSALYPATGRFTAYRFRDVSFHKALVIPAGGEPIETQLSLRPMREAAGKFLAWKEFRIYAYEDSEWSEICHGCVAVEYEVTGAEVFDQGKMTIELSHHLQDYQSGTERCVTQMQSKELYDYLGNRGLAFGPTFQSLKKIHFNDHGEATGTVNLHEWKSKTTENIVQPHVIHPAALDAVLHVSYPALTEGGKRSLPTMIPTKIRSFWIAENEVNLQFQGAEVGEAPLVNVHSRAELVGFRNAESSFIAVDAKSGKPCIAGGLELTAVAGYNSFIPNGSNQRHICYGMDWKPDLDLMDALQINNYCSSGIDLPTPASESLIEEKVLICYLALRKLNPKHLHENSPKKSIYLQKYLSWMEHQLSNESLTVSQWSQWSQSDLNELADNGEYVLKLQDTVAAKDAEGKLIVRVARNLTGILKGEVDALSLLFNDNLMYQYYRYSHGSTSPIRKAQRWIDAFAHKHPDIKVLEIGGGTGGATDHFIDTLMHHRNEGGAPRFSEYVFTDISPSFFEEAKARFSGCGSRMVFSTLDIEQDPLAQGFRAAEYDLVIASNYSDFRLASYLVTLTDMEKGLTCDRELKAYISQHTQASQTMARGGKLVLHEATSPENILPGFIFGLLPGYWLSTEDSRKWSPLVATQDWDQILSSCDFSGVDIALVDPPEKPHLPCSSAMVATALNAEEPVPLNSKVKIVISENSPLQSQIAHQLTSNLKGIGDSSREVIALEKAATTDIAGALCILLSEIDESLLHNVSEETYAIIKRITLSADGILWITNLKGAVHDPKAGMVNGLARCLQEETPRLKFITLALSEVRDISSAAHNIWQVFQSTLYKSSATCETEYTEVDGMLCINRLIEANLLNTHVAQKTTKLPPEEIPFRQDPSRRLMLTVDTPGMLDTLHFVDADINPPLGSDEIEVEVKAVGLNFKDVLIALGQSAASDLGVECAGVITAVGANAEFKVGERVCCFVDGSMRTYARSKIYATMKMPENMSFQSAAAFPIVFLTAYYALMYKERMKSGESILIHSGAGGLGQACIQLAKLLNADIFVTVGTEKKKRFLMNSYAIPEDHIFSSRTDSFRTGIMSITHGRGVDVIVNTLAGEGQAISWECIAPFGRFLELGKSDILNFGSLSMFPFAKGASFTGIDLVFLLHNAKHVIRESLQAVAILLREQKITMPSPLQVYNASQITEAFRHLASGTSKGKIVIDFQAEDSVPVVPSMLPTYSFDPNASYLIAGGLGGLGRSIAQWMASRNAKHLILLSRSSTHSPAAQTLLTELRAKGVNVVTPPCDVSNRTSLTSALAEARRSMPEIKGCIQGSMVLKDATFANMTLPSFHAALNPKVHGSQNLHDFLPPALDFFILLSSLSGIAGRHGQANYAVGNTYQDALAHHRVARGQKAVSLDLGHLLSIGYVAEAEGLADRLLSQGYTGLTEQELHALLDYYCNPSLSLPSPLHSQVVTGIELPAALRARHIDVPSAMSRPLFRHLFQMDVVVAQHPSSTGGEHWGESETSPTSCALHLAAAETAAEVAEILTDCLRGKLARTLAIEKGNIDVGRPMHVYGVDSLSAVEIRTWFETAVGVDVAVFEILGNLSIVALGEVVVGRSQFSGKRAKESKKEKQMLGNLMSK